jgi:signal transduction histidine kinase
MRGLWTLSLRGRLMTIGVVGMLIGLTGGAFVLYATLSYAVNHALDDEASAAAREVAAMVDEQRLPNPVPVSGAQVIQVIDAEDRVVSGSATADRLTPLLRPAELERALAGKTVIVPGARAGVIGPLRVRAISAGPGGDPVSVIVAVQVADVRTSQIVLRTSLMIAIPLLVAVLAVIAWRVIGWTLRPVEQLRLGAERIGSSARNEPGQQAARAEERLPVPSARDEIQALALTLNDMLSRLSAARARQRSFVADAAHELRSPLASMRTQLEVAQRLGEAGDLPADLLPEVDRLAALVEDLLLLARADADAPPPAELARIDVAELLVEVEAGYANAPVIVEVVPGSRAVGPGADAGKDVAGGEPDRCGAVLAARGELRRALSNLVDNAVRHAASRVRLSAAVADGWVVIAVEDDGPGIPLVDRERVFDRFTRLDDARDRDAGGTGLGLPIVRELVRRAGGTVGFGTDPGISRAEIHLPALRD